MHENEGQAKGSKAITLTGTGLAAEISEIGAELFLSVRTVEWHLRKVFMKLKISSRRELRAALPAPTLQGSLNEPEG